MRETARHNSFCDPGFSVGTQPHLILVIKNFKECAGEGAAPVSLECFPALQRQATLQCCYDLRTHPHRAAGPLLRHKLPVISRDPR